MTNIFELIKSGQFSEAIDVMSSKGFDPNIKCAQGRPILSHVAMKNSVAIAKFLLYLGADINLTNSYGNYPVQTASANGHIEMVRFLLSKGADLNIKDKDGDTAICDAAYNGYIDIVNLLLINGAIIDFKNNEGLTPIDIAKQKGHFQIVKLLSDNLQRKKTVINDNVDIDTECVRYIKEAKSGNTRILTTLDELGMKANISVQVEIANMYKSEPFNNAKKAEEWYKIAVNGGSKVAKIELDKLKENKTVSEKSSTGNRTDTKPESKYALRINDLTSMINNLKK